MRALISALLVAVLAGPAFALTSASNRTDGGVTVRSNVATGVVVDPGDAVSFQYQSARSGAVLVFDIDTQGNVSLLTDHPINVNAHDTRQLPEDNSELFAEGQPGVEFVFAVAADDPGAFDSDAIASLRDGSRRITGDPFIAANMLAAELVRNISQQTVFMGYTYFYVSSRVDYPCYLCGTCDGTGRNDCAGSHIAQNFDRGVSLAYPIARGYDMSEDASTSTVEDTTTDVAMPDQQDAVNFYPYGSEIHYADPVAMNLWYNWGWYDPYYWYYPYSYPYCGYPYGISIGFGWGWGWGWGGYYCGGWYNPYWGCGGYPGYCNGYYGGGSYYSGNVVKYKSQYKGGSNYASANTLARNRTYAMKRDTGLQVASKGTKAWSTPVAYHSKTSTSMKSYPMASTRHVKTSVSGSRVVQGAWADGRSKSYAGTNPNRSRNSAMYKGGSKAGRTVMDRGGYTRSRSGVYNGGGSTRMKSGAGYSNPNTPYRSRGAWSPSYNTPRSGNNSAPAYRGNSGSRSYSPPSHGWSGGSGGRGGYSGGAMRGGGGGSGGHGGYSGGAMRGGGGSGGARGGGGKGR
jgi:hypothetical protein